MCTLRTARSLTSRNISSAPPARTLMPFHYFGTSCLSQESGARLRVGLRRWGQGRLLVLERQPGSTKIAADHLRVIREGDLRVLELGVPGFLPLEAEVALVAGLPERLNLPLDGDVPAACKHVFALLAVRHG